MAIRTLIYMPKATLCMAKNTANSKNFIDKLNVFDGFCILSQNRFAGLVITIRKNTAAKNTTSEAEAKSNVLHMQMVLMQSASKEELQNI